MANSAFKYAAIYAGRYEVHERGTYRLLGEVQKQSDRLGGGWIAKVQGRTLKDGGGQVAARYRRREDAANALLMARGSSGA